MSVLCCWYLMQNNWTENNLLPVWRSGNKYKSYKVGLTEVGKRYLDISDVFASVLAAKVVETKTKLYLFCIHIIKKLCSMQESNVTKLYEKSNEIMITSQQVKFQFLSNSKT